MRHPAIADGGIFVAVLADPSARSDIVEDGKDLLRLRIPVIEEKLSVGLLWIPVEHRALLRVPAAGAIDGLDGVLVPRIDQADIGRFARTRHVVLK